MRVLDLFSGIGGFSLGLERAGMETVAFCEFDKKAQLVLKKHWPDVPIYDDVRELTYGKLKEDGVISNPKSAGARANKRGIRGLPKRCSPQSERMGGRTRATTAPTIDLICGGFPCQPFSVAGQRKGQEDDRHLWPEYFRLIQEIRPRWVIGENVAGLINMGLDQVLADLESENYTVQTFNIPACAVNAPHRRDRVWIVANSRHRTGGDGERGIVRGNGTGEFQEGIGPHETIKVARSGGASKIMAYSHKQGLERRPETLRQKKKRGSNAGHNREDSCEKWRNRQWDFEPDVGRVANGIPNRMDRLKQLGNAVVPQVVEVIGRAIMSVDAK